MEYPIGAYLDDYTRLEQPGVSAQLHDLVRTYPWFTLGRYMQLRSLRNIDPAGYNRAIRQADVRLFAHPYPQVLLDDEFSVGVPDTYDAYLENSNVETYTPGTLDTISVIDDFLNGDGFGSRIAPPSAEMAYNPEDISTASVTEDGEIATETLAEIYLAQGLPDRALEIYCKLSLRYPEKSTYFANLIADVQAYHRGW